MERNWFNKCKKSRQHILTCLEEAFRAKDLNLILENVKRLNELTGHYQKDIWLTIDQNDILKSENQELLSENRRLQDDLFLQTNSSKGRYSEAKKMLDDFYNGQ